MKQVTRITLAAAAAALGLSACETSPYGGPGYPQAQQYPNQYPNQYPTTSQYPTYPQGQYAYYGYVESVEAIPVEQRSTAPGIGAIGGAIAGGVLGNQVGHGTGRAAATVGGAVAGGVIGHQVEQHVRGPQNATSFRIRVRMDDGSYQTITQDNVNNIRVGDRVRVENGQVFAG